MEPENTMRGEQTAIALMKLSTLSQAQMEYFIRVAEAAQRQGALSPFPADQNPFQRSTA